MASPLLNRDALMSSRTRSAKASDPVDEPDILGQPTPSKLAAMDAFCSDGQRLARSTINIEDTDDNSSIQIIVDNTDNEPLNPKHNLAQDFRPSPDNSRRSFDTSSPKGINAHDQVDGATSLLPQRTSLRSLPRRHKNMQKLPSSNPAESFKRQKEMINKIEEWKQTMRDVDNLAAGDDQGTNDPRTLGPSSPQHPDTTLAESHLRSELLATPGVCQDTANSITSNNGLDNRTVDDPPSNAPTHNLPPHLRFAKVNHGEPSGTEETSKIHKPGVEIYRPPPCRGSDLSRSKPLGIRREDVKMRPEKEVWQSSKDEVPKTPQRNVSATTQLSKSVSPKTSFSVQKPKTPGSEAHRMTPVTNTQHYQGLPGPSRHSQIYPNNTQQLRNNEFGTVDRAETLPPQASEDDSKAWQRPRFHPEAQISERGAVESLKARDMKGITRKPAFQENHAGFEESPMEDHSGGKGKGPACEVDVMPKEQLYPYQDQARSLDVKKRQHRTKKVESKLVSRSAEGTKQSSSRPGSWEVRSPSKKVGLQSALDVGQWAHDQALDQAQNPVILDTDDPDFTTGIGLVDGDVALQAGIEASLHETKPHQRNVLEPKRHFTSQDAINETTSKRTPSTTHSRNDGLSKEERRAQRLALQEANNKMSDELVSNGTRPEANIYMRPVEAKDAAPIAEIYNHYVKNSVLTPEIQLKDADEWKDEIQECEDSKCPFVVAILADENPSRKKIVKRLKQEFVVGFAYVVDYGDSANTYRFTTELYVYVEPNHLRKGIGKTLMDRMMAATSPYVLWKDPVPFLDNGDREKWIGGAMRCIKTILISILFSSDGDYAGDGQGEKELEWKKNWLARYGFQQCGLVPNIGFKDEKRYVLSSSFRNNSFPSQYPYSTFSHLQNHESNVRCLQEY